MEVSECDSLSDKQLKVLFCILESESEQEYKDSNHILKFFLFFLIKLKFLF